MKRDYTGSHAEAYAWTVAERAGIPNPEHWPWPHNTSDGLQQWAEFRAEAERYDLDWASTWLEEQARAAVAGQQIYAPGAPAPISTAGTEQPRRRGPDPAALASLAKLDAKRAELAAQGLPHGYDSLAKACGVHRSTVVRRYKGRTAPGLT